MSRILGRTWELLSHSWSPSEPRWPVSSFRDHPSKSLPIHSLHFFESLVQSSSKTAERTLIDQEIQSLDKELKEPSVKDSRIHEALMICLVLHTLHYDVSFIHVHALHLTQKGSLLQKKMGYLAISYFLDENDELIFLLMNTLLKDLEASNVLYNSFALSAACTLVPKDSFSLLQSSIVRKTSHTYDVLRKKSLICLYQNYLKDTNNVSLKKDLEFVLRRALKDSDPGVVSVAIQVTHDFVSLSKNETCDLLTPLLSIHAQILNHKFPAEYSFNGVHAPWTQMTCLRTSALILSHISDRNERLEIEKTLFTEYLHQILSSIEGNITKYSSQGICVEVVEAVNSLICDKEEITTRILSLLSLNFLSSQNSNVQITGLNSLVSLCKSSKLRLSVSQEKNIMEFLQSSDEILVRKTLEYCLVTAQENNVKYICEKVFNSIKDSKDLYFKRKMSNHLLSLSLRFIDYLGIEAHIGICFRLLQISLPSYRLFIISSLKEVVDSFSASEKRLKVGDTLRDLVEKIVKSTSAHESLCSSIVDLYFWSTSRFPRFPFDWSLWLSLAKYSVLSALEALTHFCLTHYSDISSEDVLESFVKSLILSSDLSICDKASELSLLMSLLKEETPKPLSSVNLTLSALDGIVTQFLEETPCVYEPNFWPPKKNLSVSLSSSPILKSSNNSISKKEELIRQTINENPLTIQQEEKSEFFFLELKDLSTKDLVKSFLK